MSRIYEIHLKPIWKMEWHGFRTGREMPKRSIGYQNISQKTSRFSQSSKGKPSIIYIGTLDQSLGALLVQENTEDKEKAPYYLSQTFSMEMYSYIGKSVSANIHHTKN